jgi:hypothetical protein
MRMVIKIKELREKQFVRKYENKRGGKKRVGSELWIVSSG